MAKYEEPTSGGQAMYCPLALRRRTPSLSPLSGDTHKFEHCCWYKWFTITSCLMPPRSAEPPPPTDVADRPELDPGLEPLGV